jgi:hypothetical protein
MPLKLRPPRAGKTPCYYIRGTYLGVYVEESTGTCRREIAEQLLRKKRDEIECGAVARPGEPTFAEAAINYMTAGGERRFLTPLIHYFGAMALSSIDQSAIDRAAALIYPDGDPATRNRQIYTPVSCSSAPGSSKRSSARSAGVAVLKLTGSRPSKPSQSSRRRAKLRLRAIQGQNSESCCGCSATPECASATRSGSCAVT